MGGWERSRAGGGGGGREEAAAAAERDVAERRLWGLTGLDLAGPGLAGTHTLTLAGKHTTRRTDIFSFRHTQLCTHLFANMLRRLCGPH